MTDSGSDSPISHSTDTGHRHPPSASSKGTTPPPSSLPVFLHHLWDHLFSSPFLRYDTIRFISTAILDAATDRSLKDTDLDLSVSNYTDWVVVASLRQGRERGIRGASDAVKEAVSDRVCQPCHCYCIDVPFSLSRRLRLAVPPYSIHSSADQLPFPWQKQLQESLRRAEGSGTSEGRTEGGKSKSRKKSKGPRVRVEGLDAAEPQWCLIDGGKVVVHVMTETARATWEVEGVAISNIAAKGVTENSL